MHPTPSTRKRRLSRLASLGLIAPLCLALAALPVLALTATTTLTLNAVTATTSTAATGVATAGAEKVTIQVWSSGTPGFTVLLEEQASDQAAPALSPWVTVHTMVDCTSGGIGTVDGDASTPCKFSTLTPAARTRLRVSARTDGTIYGTVTVVR